MKKLLFAGIAAGLIGCTSVDSTTVSGTEISADGQAVAVVQGTSLGFSALFYLVDFVQSDLDTVINKLLVSEAKAMGGNKVQILDATTRPRHGVFALVGLPFIINIIDFPYSQARGVVLR